MRIWLFLALALSMAVPVSAQQETFESVDLRVISVREGGQVTVDRGKSDGLAKGDLVVLRPKEGGSLRGTVIRVDDRSSVVQLREKDAQLAPGTRGEVLIPASRVPAGPVIVAPVTQTTPPPKLPDPVEESAPEPAWQTEDKGYQPGMPLLAEVQPVRPEARPPITSGRIYLAGQGILTSESGRNSAFLRGGFDYITENPFGKGGGLRLDGELNWRTVSTPQDGTESYALARLDRLSYHRGGTRFDPTRWELGRFLQHGMPEFGLVDGYEWTKRRKNNHRYGVSVGYMPDPQPQVEQWEDFQLAAFYSWAVDSSERFTVDGGYQKTWHKGSADRDLFVARIEYLPLDGWDFQGSAWIDYYRNDDPFKDPGLDLTWARASAGKTWDTGNGIDLTYRHGSFPDIERSEALPEPSPVELADAYNDRLAAAGWRWLGENRRLHTEWGIWNDEVDVGGDADLGVEVHNVGRDNTADITAFGTAGRYEWVLGGRFSYGEAASNGRWDAMYELGFNHRYGFSFDRDDIWQHRLRLTRDLRIFADWNLHLSGDILLWDTDGAFTLGFYLQRMF